MVEYTVKPFIANTWPDFSRLIEANNGVWGGCWCMGYTGPVAGSEQGEHVER